MTRPVRDEQAIRAAARYPELASLLAYVQRLEEWVELLEQRRSVGGPPPPTTNDWTNETSYGGQLV